MHQRAGIRWHCLLIFTQFAPCGTDYAYARHPTTEGKQITPDVREILVAQGIVGVTKPSKGTIVGFALTTELVVACMERV